MNIPTRLVDAIFRCSKGLARRIMLLLVLETFEPRLSITRFNV